MGRSVFLSGFWTCSYDEINPAHIPSLASFLLKSFLGIDLFTFVTMKLILFIFGLAILVSTGCRSTNDTAQPDTTPPTAANGMIPGNPNQPVSPNEGSPPSSRVPAANPP